MVNCLCVSTCGKTFASRRKLLYHEQRCKTCNGVAKFRCGKCGKLFLTPIALKEHEVVHSDVRKFKCHICDKTYKRRSDCSRHVKEIHLGRHFECHICDRRFNRKSSCNRHVEGHFGIKNFNCMKCDRFFAHYHNALSHEEICCKNATPVTHCASDSGESDMTDIEVSDDE